MSVWDRAETILFGTGEDGTLYVATGRYSDDHDGRHYYEYGLTREKAIELRDEINTWLAATNQESSPSE